MSTTVPGAELPPLTLEQLEGLREAGGVSDRPIVFDRQFRKKHAGETLKVWPEQAAAVRRWIEERDRTDETPS